MLKTFSYSATTMLEIGKTWELLSDLANWKTCSDVYSDLSWSGKPWKPGSCIVGNLRHPAELEFRYVLQACNPPRQITYLAHGLEPAFKTHRIVHLNLRPTENSTTIEVVSYVLGEPTAPGHGAGNLKSLTDRWLNGFVRLCDSHPAAQLPSTMTENSV